MRRSPLAGGRLEDGHTVTMVGDGQEEEAVTMVSSSHLVPISSALAYVHDTTGELLLPHCGFVPLNLILFSLLVWTMNLANF